MALTKLKDTATLALKHTTPQVSWVTNYTSPTIVRYGTKPNKLDLTATSTDVARYTSFNVTSGYIHHVPLTGLKPATTYYYLIGPPTNPDGDAGLRYFTTLPKVGQRVKDFKLAVAADIGQTNDSLYTIDHLIADQVGGWVGRIAGLIGQVKSRHSLTP